jgi:hypothetical protein
MDAAWAVVVGAGVATTGTLIGNWITGKREDRRHKELTNREDRLHKERLGREVRQRFISERRHAYARFINRCYHVPVRASNPAELLQVTNEASGFYHEIVVSSPTQVVLTAHGLWEGVVPLRVELQ